MILALPGGRNRNAPCARPLGLIDIYPTLIEICGLPSKKSLQGRSLSPLLKDPTREWDYPALTTRHPGDHAVRSKYWRYIRYANGDEELYDHRIDPHEFDNQANDPHTPTLSDGSPGGYPKSTPRTARASHDINSLRNSTGQNHEPGNERHENDPAGNRVHSPRLCLLDSPLP